MSLSFLSGKKILITGGTGHLGSALCHYLVDHLHLTPSDIRVFYLAGTSTASLADIAGLDIRPGNILDFEDVRRACAGMEYVFHMAASTSFDPRHKRHQWLVNVEGTRHILEVVRQSSTVQKICYTSTVNVLGVPNPLGTIGDIENSSPYANRPRFHSFPCPEEVLDFIEEVRGDPSRRWEKHIGLGYFDSKLAAQELVQLQARESGLSVISVLPGTCFGPHDFFIGNGRYLLALYRRKMPGILKGGLSAGHVMDVVEGHLLALERGKLGERYIITGAVEDNLHFKDLVKIMSEILRQQFPAKKIRPPSVVWPKGLALAAAFLSERYSRLTRRPCPLSRDMVRAGSVPLFYTSAKATQELGYRPQRTFREAVQEMVRFYQAHGFFETKALFH